MFFPLHPGDIWHCWEEEEAVLGTLLSEVLEVLSAIGGFVHIEKPSCIIISYSKLLIYWRIKFEFSKEKKRMEEDCLHSTILIHWFIIIFFISNASILNPRFSCQHWILTFNGKMNRSFRGHSFCVYAPFRRSPLIKPNCPLDVRFPLWITAPKTMEQIPQLLLLGIRHCQEMNVKTAVDSLGDRVPAP